jgi:TPR repeat protein
MQTGMEPKRNLELAFQWYTVAAKAGNVIAQHNLAAAYANGSGTSIDLIEAQFWYLKAAKRGSYLSQECLGIMYLQGQGVTKDLTLALGWFLIATTNSNNPDHRLIINQIKGQLTTDEIYKAEKFAMEFLPEIFQSDIFNEEKQASSITRGINAFEEKKYNEAYEAFKMPAHQGNVIACRYMGFIYKYGLGQTQNYSEAGLQFDKASIKGDYISQYELGELVECGLGVKEDPELSYKYFKLSADSDYPPPSML